MRIAEIAAITANPRLRVLLERAAAGAAEDEIVRKLDDVAKRARISK